MDGQTDGWTYRWTDGLDGRPDWLTDGRVGEWMDGWREGWTVGRADGRDAETNGPMDRRKEGRTDGCCLCLGPALKYVFLFC